MAIDPSTGVWSYALDNGLATTQGLYEGQVVTETFTATVTANHGATDTQTVTITINGTNDAPDITSTSGPAVAGSVTEAGLAIDDTTPVTGPASASGTLTSSDVDSDASAVWSITTSSAYGTMAIDPSTGVWSYALDNGLATTQGLYEGQVVTETFTATVTDNHGATDTQTVTITINGTNDAPDITSTSGPAVATVTEAGLAIDDTTPVTVRRARAGR